LTISGQSHHKGERGLWIFILLLSSLSSYKVGQRVERSSTVHSTDPSSETPKLSMQSKELRLSKPHSESSLSDQNLAAPHFQCPPVSCPPCNCETPPPPPPPRKRRSAPPLKATSPVDRQQLLAWVKRYSPRLKRCRDAGQPIYRLHAKVTLNSKRERILKAKVNGADVPRDALSCVERDIQKWPAPVNLSKSHPPLLIFGLQLN
jgi:hypothetical protein